MDKQFSSFMQTLFDVNVIFTHVLYQTAPTRTRCTQQEKDVGIFIFFNCYYITYFNKVVLYSVLIYFVFVLLSEF